MERGRRPDFLMTAADHQWLDEAIAWQWEIPGRPAAFWRAWGIRHLRSWIMMLRAHAFVSVQRENGWRELWRREWLAYAIRRGWC